MKSGHTGRYTRKFETPAAFDCQPFSVNRMARRRSRVSGLAGGKRTHNLDPVEIGAQAASSDGGVFGGVRVVAGEGATNQRVHAASQRETGKQAGPPGALQG